MQDLHPISKSLIISWKKIYQSTKNEDKSKEKIETPTISLIEENDIINYKAKIETEEKDPIRKNTKILLYNSLLKWKDYPEYVYEIAMEIEEELNNYFSTGGKFLKDKYLKQAKQIVMNLQHNQEFIEDILMGNLRGNKLAAMNPQDFASEATKQLRNKIKEDAFNSRRSDWFRIKNPGTPGMYRCGKCKNNKTYSYQQQIRRADEPMTTFITCLECNHSWKQ